MKIIYIIDQPNMYGSERHLLDIIRYFSPGCSCDVELVAFSDGPMLKYVNVKFSIFSLGWVVNLITFFRLAMHIRQTAPDVIHCHQPKAAFLGSLLGRILNIPTVITVHSRAYDHAIIHKGLFKRTAVFLFHKLVLTTSVLCSGKVIYVNDGMFKKSINKKKSVFLPNWLSSLYSCGSKKTFEFEPGKKIRFISVGTVTKAKGYDILLDFLGRLSLDSINYSSIVFGGVDDSYYKELKGNPLFSDKIDFRGYTDSVIDELNEADFYVLFSRSETFGLSYLEAMSQGLPIICLDLEELKYLIPSSNVLEPDADLAYESFLNLLDSKAYSDVSARNVSRSSDFSYTYVMESLRVIYEDVRK
ncbi:glycosyltransferase family 4 protein [Vibrio scophthalmi]|uniref:glycosyltransferase family 4 protein n=1 Tax=Vibrio scophthalmi TaxID=45658 RepID=UPI00228333BF|nr:glycosyltransferase family 4 protein [Vibrio scophthalmi]MCY9804040.1 glycosyltransferase family 4 protein [Vibrio scophthalmi]